MTEEHKIPDFLEDHSQIEENIPLQSAFHPLRKTFIGLGCAWVLSVAVYLHFFYGWSSLSALAPTEFSLFLAFFFIFPLIISLFIILTKRFYSSLKQNEIVEKTLGRFLRTNDENLLSKIINKALQTQIEELNTTLQFLSAQTDTLKQELTTKAEDFKSISQTLDHAAKQNLTRIDENKNEYINLCRELSMKAQETAGVLKQNTDILKENADKIYQELNPLIDETTVAANHLKTTVKEAQSDMAQTKTDLDEFSVMSKNSLIGLAEMLSKETDKFQKAMLETADGCEQIYQKIDSGISHIENSIKSHKDLAAEQSALLDKNSEFLDSKLGSYGKLISMEVAAMIEKSGALDLNLQEKIKKFNDAALQIGSVVEGAGNSLSVKSDQAIRNIESVVKGLIQETEKLSKFVDETESKNVSIQSAAEKMSAHITGLSKNLNHTLEDLRLRSVDAVDQFNEVSKTIEKNALQLSEKTNILVTKGKQGAEYITAQQSYLSKTAENLNTVKTELKEIENNLSQTGQKSFDVFHNFKKQISDLDLALKTNFKELENEHSKSEQRLKEIKARYAVLGLSGFMGQMAHMIEDLENLSVNLNRYFDKDAEDDLWKRFYGGDHGAFAHHIIKKLGRKEIARIRDLYEKDNDFRELSDKYLGEFEVLLNAAEKSDRPDTMLSIISGSEIGKIYYVLARALDRLGS